MVRRRRPESFTVDDLKYMLKWAKQAEVLSEQNFWYWKEHKNKEEAKNAVDKMDVYRVLQVKIKAHIEYLETQLLGVN